MHQCENCKKDQQVASGQEKMGQRDMAKDSKPGAKEQEQPKDESSGQEPKDPAQAQKEPNGGENVKNNRTSEETPPKADVGTLVARDGSGRWGRLPQRVIEQMYDNGQRKLPEKYRLMLEEYFRRLPQQSR